MCQPIMNGGRGPLPLGMTFLATAFFAGGRLPPVLFLLTDFSALASEASLRADSLGAAFARAIYGPVVMYAP